MRRPRKKKPLRRLAPKPAPGDLRIVQAFLNTVQHKAGTDELTAPRELSDWLIRHGLLASAAKLTKTDLGRALDVRDGIRALVVASGDDVDADAVRRLDRVARVARAHLRFHDDGSSRYEAGDFEEALGHLITLVVLNRREGLWPRLKICADSACRTVFYDFTTNGATKWCTARCGDRLRALNYRRTERYKARPHHSPPRIPRMFLPPDTDD